MKHIVKGESPEEFEDWKNKENENWQPSWDNFQNPEKSIVKEELLIEQGYICCYCGFRIENDVFTEIEHIKPRIECVGDEEYKAIEYNNFLASCNGSAKEPKPRELHCNNYRGDKPLMINPLDPDCENNFLYTSDGIVISKDSKDEIESFIKNVLNLNATKIKNRREKIIEALEIDFKDSTKKNIKNEIASLSKKVKNRFQEMCFVSINYLENNIL